MNLKIFNTLSKKIESFKPLNDTVKVYACGPTVYNHPHIGNARPAIIGDILITSGNANIYPKDILVGKIVNVEKDNFYVLPFVDFKKIDYVQVVETK